MNITDFLEARIAEDEAQAGSGWARLGETRWETDNYGRTFPTPAAVLAECAAKRAILAFDQDEQIWEPRGFSSDTAGGSFTRGSPKNPQARHATRILAAIYKDHPDYQPEWANDAPPQN